MANDANSLVPQQVLWTRDDKGGVLRTYVGPTPLDSKTGDEVCVVPDPSNPLGWREEDSLNSAIQGFTTLQSGQYAVVTNPPRQRSAEWPNGNWKRGRNETLELVFGSKAVIANGSFPLMPGQDIEVRDVHRLTRRDFVVVRIQDPHALDTEAPYYRLLVQCSRIRGAVVDTDDDGVHGPTDAASDHDSEHSPQAGDHDSEHSPQAGDHDSEHSPEPVSEGTPPHEIFEEGQLVIIPGSLTETFIPPTGSDVVAEGSDDANFAVNPQAHQDDGNDADDRYEPSPADRVRTLISRGALDQHSLGNALDDAGLYRHFDTVRSQYGMAFGGGPSGRGARSSHGEQFLGGRGPERGYEPESIDPGEALFTALESSLGTSELAQLADSVGGPLPEAAVSKAVTAPIEEPKPQSVAPKVVRQAVVLGPYEFAVLLGADGQPRVHRGGDQGGLVYPGPYDRFQILRSRNRVYDAFHLRKDLGLVIRIIADRVSQEELAAQLPDGVELALPEYTKGMQVFVKGVEAYLFPDDAFEVCDKDGNAHVGNDHSNVFVKAIGVDDKSGIYRADIATGNVETVAGPEAVLINPLTHGHFRRQIHYKLWNLMLGANDASKVRTGGDNGTDRVETPWAMSIPIPGNHACLARSRAGDRVLAGAGTELLKHDEVLEVLTLSTGRPKDDAHRVETCFLKITGNRVTDQVKVTTADFVEIEIDIELHIDFEGTSEDARKKWFFEDDYVALATNHVRSVLRAAAEGRTLGELQGGDMAEFVRSTILGAKGSQGGSDAGESAGGSRPGMVFDENNMRVTDVEILSHRLTDEVIARKLADANVTIATLQIGDTKAQAELKSAQLRAEVDAENAKLKQEDLERQLALALKEVETSKQQTGAQDQAHHELAMAKAAGDAKLASDKQQSEQALTEAAEEFADTIAELARARETANAASQLAISKADNEEDERNRQKLVDLGKVLIAANSEADVARIAAVSPQLAQGLVAAADSEALKLVAQNLPKANGGLDLLLAGGGMGALAKMFDGTPLDGLLANIRDPNRLTQDNGEQQLASVTSSDDRTS